MTHLNILLKVKLVQIHIKTVIYLHHFPCLEIRSKLSLFSFSLVSIIFCVTALIICYFDLLYWIVTSCELWLV